MNRRGSQDYGGHSHLQTGPEVLRNLIMLGRSQKKHPISPFSRSSLFCINCFRYFRYMVEKHENF